MKLRKAATNYWEANNGTHNLFDAFTAGAKWQKENGMRWINASEKLPEGKGIANTVIIRNNDPNNYWVTTGFRNFSEKRPSLYFVLGAFSYLTVDERGDGRTTYNVEFIQWLYEPQN
jgi:hypothetical protein